MSKSEDVQLMEAVLGDDLPLTAQMVLNLLIRNAYNSGLAEGALAAGLQVELCGDFVECREAFDEEGYNRVMEMVRGGLL